MVEYLQKKLLLIKKIKSKYSIVLFDYSLFYNEYYCFCRVLYNLFLVDMYLISNSNLGLSKTIYLTFLSFKKYAGEEGSKALFLLYKEEKRIKSLLIYVYSHGLRRITG